MPKAIDICGQIFSGWTVLRQVSKGRSASWSCRCQCGTIRDVNQSNLISGISKNCGCIRREALSVRSTTHGMSRTREWRIWCNIISRCTNPNVESYKDYGGRGITVCERWRNSFADFYADMGPSNGLDIDRKDNNGNYEPGNCHWVSHKVNSRNKRSSRMFTHNGETKCLKELAESLGINYRTTLSRLKLGWSFEEAISK